MRALIEKGTAVGQMAAPPSKSMAHRLIIAAALSGGVSTVRGVDMSQDITATVECLRALGANITVDGTSLQISGITPCERNATLHCNESGSTLRFMLPICLALGGNYRLCGSSRLMERSLEVYEQLCCERGINLTRDRQSVSVNGRLTADTFRVAGNISSQFISGLMLAACIMDGDSCIELTTALESSPYVGMTADAIRRFGGTVDFDGGYTVCGRLTARDCTVEGDYSNAAFFDVFNCLGGSVQLDGLLPDSLQGDKIYRKYMDDICRGGATVDISDCPDLGPVLFALAAVKGGARFEGIARLRIKESDRVAAMAEELAKIGVSLNADQNTAVISGAAHPPTSEFDGHNDHRIVMATATLCTLYGGAVNGAEAVAKSLPDYFERLQKLGIRTEIQ